MINDIFILILVLLIIIIEYNVQKKHLGIILLHNNDHTLNKVVQYISAFFEKLEVHFTIVIIKESKSNKTKIKRSTGKLFNIGYRQLPKMDSYLFIDSKYCKIDNFYKILLTKSVLTMDNIYPKNKIELIDNICGLFISRDYLKKIDGFSNQSNNNFSDFVKQLEHDTRSKTKHGGYLSNNVKTKYHILDKINITSHAIRIIIDIDR
jgi:hypothetical protein